MSPNQALVALSLRRALVFLHCWNTHTDVSSYKQTRKHVQHDSKNTNARKHNTPTDTNHPQHTVNAPNDNAKGTALIALNFPTSQSHDHIRPRCRGRFRRPILMTVTATFFCFVFVPLRSIGGRNSGASRCSNAKIKKKKKKNNGL